MGVFAGIGHDHAGGGRYHRFGQHAPARVVDELDAETFKRADIPRLMGFLIFAAPAGNHHGNAALPAMPEASFCDGAELLARGMRIADGDQINAR